MQCQMTTEKDRVRVGFSGQLIFSDTAAFADILKQITAAGAKFCVVDLLELEQIDSSGLRMLLLVHDLCRDNGLTLEFHRPVAQVRDMLFHSRFDTIVTISD